MFAILVVLVAFVLLGWIGAKTTGSNGVTYDTRFQIDFNRLSADVKKAKDAAKAKLPKKGEASPAESAPAQ